ncbi:uncharacterized protein LOC114551467 [Perca flavescens]|uniref:uncharacterized protein LOC114551467 n=1 Tax=Perca flavescens TaxID=8167 RepID=UPI00106E6361|nr:uncharacterized protein LOC114551467 [Perca flavescens]
MVERVAGRLMEDGATTSLAGLCVQYCQNMQKANDRYIARELALLRASKTHPPMASTSSSMSWSSTSSSMLFFGLLSGYIVAVTGHRKGVVLNMTRKEVKAADKLKNGNRIIRRKARPRSLTAKTYPSRRSQLTLSRRQIKAPRTREPQRTRTRWRTGTVSRTRKTRT